MRFFFSEPKHIEQLEPLLKQNHAQRDANRLRRSIPICVIDDQPFSPLTNLRNNHFQVSEISDASDIRVVEPYAIILCDLQGVGAKLDPEKQGAHLIAEIKRSYPDKHVIAYTGATPTSVLYRAAKEYADGIIKKDASLEVWTETLDKGIKQVTDAIVVWRKFRVRLLDNGFSPIDLVVLEDRFVRNYEEGAEPTKAAITSSIGKLNLASDVRAIAQGFISSIIFKLVFG